MKNKVIYMLLSVVIAIGLWLYVITVVSPESEQTYYNIPVVLNNESVLNDKGLMIASEKEPTVTLKLRGNRSDLNSLKNSDITLIADLSKINDAGEQSLTYSISYPGNFASNAFEVLSRSPDRITLEIVEWETKEVPVKVDFVGSVPPDYIDYRSEAVISDEKVTITGPKEIVDRITQARVDVDLTNQTQTISKAYRYTLSSLDGKPVDAAQVQVNIEEIFVSVKIQRVKELQLKVEIDYQDSGLTEKDIQIIYSQETIKVSGSEKALQALENPLVIGTVKISEILQNGVFTFPIRLTGDVQNQSGLEEVTATISFPGLKVMTLSVLNIITGEPPEGMMVTDVGTKICSVTLLVPEDQSQLITAEDLQIQVDMSNAEPGEGLYKAQVVITHPDYQDVAVVGTYNIMVKVDLITP